MTKIAVFGASGTTGRQILRQAVSRGWHVRAVARSWDGAGENGSALELVKADVLEDDLSKIVSGVDAVISALGLSADPQTLADPPPVYTKGSARIADAMADEGVRRLLVISASFVVRRDIGPALFRNAALPALDPLFRQMAEMEASLREREDLDWTIARPGWLLNEPLTGDYTVSDSVIPDDLIRTRHADLAHFLLGEVDANNWVRGHPAPARREAPHLESSLALPRELAG